MQATWCVQLFHDLKKITFKTSYFEEPPFTKFSVFSFNIKKDPCEEQSVPVNKKTKQKQQNKEEKQNIYRTSTLKNFAKLTGENHK